MLLVGGGGRGCEVGLSPFLTALFWCDSERIFYCTSVINPLLKVTNLRCKLNGFGAFVP
jgi:hypothetical protein